MSVGPEMTEEPEPRSTDSFSLIIYCQAVWMVQGQRSWPLSIPSASPAFPPPVFDVGPRSEVILQIRHFGRSREVDYHVVV